VTISAMLVILVSLILAGKSCSPDDQPKENMDRLSHIVTISAEETAHFLRGEGKVLLLSTVNSPSLQFDLTKLFKSTLEKQGLQVLYVEGLSPEEDSEAVVPRGFFPGKALLPLLLQYPDIDAVISLIGVPYFEEIPIETPPHFIAAYGVAPDMPLKQLIQSGWLSMVITPRFSPVVEPGKIPSSPAAWFEQHYQIFTAENARDLPQ